MSTIASISTAPRSWRNWDYKNKWEIYIQHIK